MYTVQIIVTGGGLLRCLVSVTFVLSYYICAIDKYFLTGDKNRELPLGNSPTYFSGVM